MMAEAFAIVPRSSPLPSNIELQPYRPASQDGMASAGELLADYEAALQRRRERYGAARATVEAVMYELRTRGVAALSAPNCQRRLSELSAVQVRNVIERLDDLRPKYPAITDDLLLLIAELIDES